MQYNPALSGLFSMYVQRHIDEVTQGQPREELPFILTYTGKKFRHLDPRPEDVCIEDIAHALSRLCRYTGHVDAPLYSVAQHSVLVSHNCNTKDAMWGLLHDATEAYVADMSRPLKQAPGMEGYRLYERKAAHAICDHFGLDREEPVSVKHADCRMLTTEMHDLIVHAGESDWLSDRAAEYPRYSFVIQPWSQAKAERRFLARFRDLCLVRALRLPQYWQEP